MGDHPGPLAGIREALEFYQRRYRAYHSSGCPVLSIVPPRGPCNCGESDALDKARAALASLDSMKGEEWWRTPTRRGFEWSREIRPCAKDGPFIVERVLVIPFPEEAKRG